MSRLPLSLGSNTSTEPSLLVRSTTLCVLSHFACGLPQRAGPVPRSRLWPNHTTSPLHLPLHDLWLSNNQRFLFCTCYKFVLMCLAIMTNTHTFPSHACPNCSGHQVIFLHHCSLGVKLLNKSQRSAATLLCTPAIFLSRLDVNWPVKCWEGMHAWAMSQTQNI